MGIKKQHLARLLERDPVWVARRLLDIGLERGLVSRNVADVLVTVRTGPEADVSSRRNSSTMAAVQVKLPPPQGSPVMGS